MKTSILTCAFLVSTAVASNAATFTGSAQGAWTSVDGTFGYATSTASDSATVTWGVEWVSTVPETTTAIAAYVNQTAPDSNYMKFSYGSGWSSSAGGIFSLGTLEYENGTSYATSHDFEGASLTIDVGLSNPSFGGLLSFEYAFDVLTTTNNGVSVPDDADTLVAKQAPSAKYFTVGGQRYMLEILGLSTDGGSTFANEFTVYEAWQGGQWHDVDPARADVYARITPAVVPVPASLPLLLGAMGAVGYLSRRKRKAA